MERLRTTADAGTTVADRNRRKHAVQQAAAALACP